VGNKFEKLFSNSNSNSSLADVYYPNEQKPATRTTAFKGILQLNSTGKRTFYELVSQPFLCLVAALFKDPVPRCLSACFQGHSAPG
jgi:hypothetical protein